MHASFAARYTNLLYIRLFRWIDFTQFGFVFVHNGLLGRIACLLSKWSDKKLLLMESMDPSQPHSLHAHGLKICPYRQSLTAAEFTVHWGRARPRPVLELKGLTLGAAMYSMFSSLIRTDTDARRVMSLYTSIIASTHLCAATVQIGSDAEPQLFTGDCCRPDQNIYHHLSSFCRPHCIFSTSSIFNTYL